MMHPQSSYKIRTQIFCQRSSLIMKNIPLTTLRKQFLCDFSTFIFSIFLIQTLQRMIESIVHFERDYTYFFVHFESLLQKVRLQNNIFRLPHISMEGKQKVTIYDIIGPICTMYSTMCGFKNFISLQTVYMCLLKVVAKQLIQMLTILKVPQIISVYCKST